MSYLLIYPTNLSLYKTRNIFCLTLLSHYIYKTLPISPLFYVWFVVDSIQLVSGRPGSIDIVVGCSLCVIVGLGIRCVGD